MLAQPPVERRFTATKLQYKRTHGFTKYDSGHFLRRIRAALFQQLDQELLRRQHPRDAPSLESHRRLGSLHDQRTPAAEIAQLLLQIPDLVAGVMQPAALLVQKA